VIYADPGSVTNAPAAWFSTALTGIFSALINRAVAVTPSNSTRKYFATAEMDFDPKLYGLAQCAPDLMPAQCRDCLGNLVAVVTTQFLKRRAPGTSAFVVWCSLRYSGVSPVFEGWAMLQLAAPPEPPPEATLAPPASESGAGRVGHSIPLFPRKHTMPKKKSESAPMLLVTTDEFLKLASSELYMFDACRDEKE